MGRKSTIKVRVYVKLSVTVALESSVKNSINSDLIKNNLANLTNGYAKLVKAHDPTVPGGRGIFWHYLEYSYDISLDLYNLVKINSNTLTAQLSKLFKRKRKEMVMEKVRLGIKDGFKKNINSNVFNHTAVKLHNVRIQEI